MHAAIEAVIAGGTLRELRLLMQIVRGVCMGGWEDAKVQVASGKMAATDVKFFSRYCGWAPGQLDRVRRVNHTAVGPGQRIAALWCRKQ